MNKTDTNVIVVVDTQRFASEDFVHTAAAMERTMKAGLNAIWEDAKGFSAVYTVEALFPRIQKKDVRGSVEVIYCEPDALEDAMTAHHLPRSLTLKPRLLVVNNRTSSDFGLAQAKLLGHEYRVPALALYASPEMDGIVKPVAPGKLDPNIELVSRALSAESFVQRAKRAIVYGF